MQYTLYEQLRWWLPIISAFGLVIKAYTSTKKSVTEFAERLLNNHLSGIETATISTEKETKVTNSLLRDNTGKLDMLQATVTDHHEKNLQVWTAVTENLTVLRERTRACSPSRSKRSAKRK
jgi:hypothetical protein